MNFFWFLSAYKSYIYTVKCAIELCLKSNMHGTSLVVQWVRLCAPNAGGSGSIPGPGTRSRVHATTKKSAHRN